MLLLLPLSGIDPYFRHSALLVQVLVPNLVALADREALSLCRSCHGLCLVLFHDIFS